MNGDLAIVDDLESARAVERRLLSATAIEGNGLGRRWIFGPLIRAFAGPLLKSQLSGQIARVVAAMAFMASAASFLLDRPWLALGFGLAGATAAEVAAFVAGFRREARWMGWAAHSGFGLQIAALIIGQSDFSWSAVHIDLSLALYALVAHQRHGMFAGLQNLVDPPLIWLIAGPSAVLLGVSTAFSFVALVAFAALLLSYSAATKGYAATK